MNRECYNLMSVYQFESYVLAQQIHHWKIVSHRRTDIKKKTCDDLINPTSENINSINVHKYLQMGKSFTVNDVKSAENTCKTLENFILKIRSAKKDLLDLWANLFDTSCVLHKI